MKNRKQINLEYIRAKNRTRRGESVLCFTKTSIEISEDAAYVLNYIDESKDLSEKFKLPIKLISITPSLCGDDFLQDLVTYKSEYKVNYA